MKMPSNLLLLVFSVLLLNACSSSKKDTADQSVENQKIVAEGATPRLISKQFSFTEGPAADKAGNVFFTDQPNDKIWKYGTDGQLSVFFDHAGRANGMYFDKDGNLISCSDENNEIWSITPDKKVTVLVSGLNNLRFNGPNDLWVHPANGGIYFTDPNYKRDYWKSTAPQIEGQKVYYLAKGSKEPVVVDDVVKKPNGIVGTPDGKYLYVADIGDNKTYKYAINPDGTLQKGQLFVEQGSDGMTIDARGNIYLTGKGVMVYDKNGKKIEQIDIPDGWTANVCFAGKKRDKLFITASKSVYILDMAVRGI